MEEQIKYEPTQEEMIQLLSQTIIQQKEQIEKLQAELSQPMPEPVINREEIIDAYLKNELKYAETKVVELRHHIADYPEDSYSHQDLQNCLLHINYLKAMLRRLYL